MQTSPFTDSHIKKSKKISVLIFPSSPFHFSLYIKKGKTIDSESITYNLREEPCAYVIDATYNKKKLKNIDIAALQVFNMMVIVFNGYYEDRFIAMCQRERWDNITG